MEKSKATVSVIVPTYNRAAMVTQTVDSILNQTRPPDEVIVVDDGSPDATAAVLATYGRRIRYLRQENAGRPAALNRGVAAAGGDYIWIMDDDDLALPGALEQHLELLVSHPDVHFSYSGHYRFTGDVPPVTLSEKDRVPCPRLDHSDFLIQLMIWFRFYMQGMLVRTECYRKVGEFDETLGFGDDYDMILRLARWFRGGYIEQPTFLLREHDGERGPAGQRRAAEERDATLREYDKQILLKLRRALALSEYLPRSASTAVEPLAAWQMREALLQRACIMIRHGLFDEGFRDIKSALADGAYELSGREQHIFSQMLNVECWWLERYPEFVPRMGAFLRRHHAYNALESCGIGLGWRIVSALRGRHYHDALQTAAHLWRLTGAAKMPAVAGMAARRRYRQRGATARSRAVTT